MTKPLYYRLTEDNQAVEESDVKKAFDSKRHVADDYIGEYRISTVFLSIDHRMLDSGLPLVFETMVFRQGPDAEPATLGKDSSQWRDLECERYSTWEQAEQGHAEMVAKYKK